MQLRGNGMCKDFSNNEFKSNEDGAVTGEEDRSVLSYVIPLNDTGSAGLGMSVKGRTQRDLTSGDSQDTGVFIKAILNGGAAWKVCSFKQLQICLLLLLVQPCSSNFMLVLGSLDITLKALSSRNLLKNN